MSAGSLAKTRGSHWLLATACLFVALGTELVSVQALKLPGHRALPTVLALLVFARSVPAPMALAYGLLTPVVVVLVTPARASMAVGVLSFAAAAVAIAIVRTWRVAFVPLLLFGATFGVLRAATSGGMHAGSLAQLLGNVLFGSLGALCAYALLRRFEK